MNEKQEEGRIMSSGISILQRNQFVNIQQSFFNEVGCDMKAKTAPPKPKCQLLAEK